MRVTDWSIVTAIKRCHGDFGWYLEATRIDGGHCLIATSLTERGSLRLLGQRASQLGMIVFGDCAFRA